MAQLFAVLGEREAKEDKEGAEKLGLKA